MRLTPSQLETSRTRPSKIGLSMFIFEPRNVLVGRINSNVSKGAMTIPYGIVTGSYTSIEPNMAILVGSQPGLQDYGRIRLRSGTSSSLMVAENDSIQWVSGAYLTVLRYWDILPVYPRIIQNPEDETDVIFYKDYDIKYAGQNNKLGTFVNAGSHRATFIENGTGTVYYSSTGTLNVAGRALTYEWAFEGGTPTGSTNAHPGNVYYTTPGDYVTRLKVNSGGGVIDTTYRYVSVRNHPNQVGGHPPILKWKMEELRGSRTEGGYSTQFTVYEPVDIRENSVVILTSNEKYGSIQTNLGGNNPNGEDIFFVGYVEAGSIRYSFDRSSVEFTASSVTALMKKSTGFSISVESKQGANSWFKLQDMDVKKAIYHYLRWHSTVLNTVDIRFTGEDRKIQFFDADRGSLFDAINGLMSDTLMGSVCSDRQGAVYAEVNPVGYTNPTGSFAPVMEITKRDWRGEPVITYNPYSPVSYIELGGIAYSGAHTGTWSAFLSGAPGDVPHERGAIESDPGGLALTGQSQLNQLTGNVFYTKKFPYPKINFFNSNPMKNLDIAPFEALQVNIASSDTVSNTELHGLYYPSSMGFLYTPENESIVSDMEVEAIVTGIPGDTIAIPEVSDDIYTPDFPNFPSPPFPPTVPVFEIVDPLSIDNVLTWIQGKGFYYTNDFSSPSPTWNEMMVNIPSSHGELLNVEMTSSGKIFAHFPGFIMKAESLGSPWLTVFNAQWEVDNPESYPFPRDQAVLAMAVDRSSDEDVFIMGSLIVTIFSTCVAYGFSWDGSRFNRVSSVFSISPSSVYRYGTILKLGGQWIMSYYDSSNQPATCVVDGSTFITSDIASHALPFNGLVFDKSTFSPNTAILKLQPPQMTIDGGDSWFSITGTYDPYQYFGDASHSIIDDGLGVIVYGRDGLSGYRASTDNGNVFNDFAVFTGTATAVNHIGQKAYIFGDNSGKFWLVDGIYANSTGTTVQNKNGNIEYLITGTFSPLVFRF